MRTQNAIEKIQIVLIGLLSLAGCKTLAEQALVDAVIEQHSEESMIELHSIVTQALNIEKIILAPDALMRSNQLIIERKTHRTLQQGVLMGRSEEVPEIFKLQIKGEKCILVHQASNKSWPLSKSKCKPLL